MTRELISIAPQTSQTILRMMGAFCSTKPATNGFYLSMALYQLIPSIEISIGKEKLKELWKEQTGKDWDETMKKLMKFNKRSIRAKSSYDIVEGKRAKQKKKDIDSEERYIRYASRVPVLMPEIFELYIMLNNMTPLHRQTIPTEAFRRLESLGQQKIIETQSKKHETPATTEISQESD